MLLVTNQLFCLFVAIGFNVEQVTYKNLKFQVWDLGGQTSIRPYWRCYFSNTDAIIYVVDSSDRERIGISKQELVSMLEVIIDFSFICFLLIIRTDRQLTDNSLIYSEIFESNALTNN